MQILQFWGKADRQDPSKAHPAICHMLDVAAVAEALLNPANTNAIPTVKQRLLLEAIGDANRNWLVLLVALHDLGKMTPGFQCKIPQLCQKFDKAQLPTSGIDEPLHGLSTALILPALLQQHTDYPKQAARLLSKTVAAHHGEFFRVPNPNDANKTSEGGWADVQHATVETLLEVLGLDWADFPFKPDLSPEFIMALAGFTAIADWLGSDEKVFRYVNSSEQPLDFAQYWIDRLTIAQQRVAELNFHTPFNPHKCQDFAALHGFEPNIYQQHSLKLLEKTHCPSLFIIETPMGSGKTEAALAIADHYLRHQLADGLYYALPTQATANQMFGRLEKFLQYNDALPDTQLHLLHAYAFLHPNYQQSPQIAAVYDDAARTQSQASAMQASEWFIGSKRGLLSPFAVGTVDQALMAVLKVKHFFVRLYGLAGKVVIIDEVHAYDAYTSVLLECLLAWLAELRCTVILLSATLPAPKRLELLKAYSPAVEVDNTDTPAIYPCALVIEQASAQVQVSNMPAMTTTRLQVQLHTVVMDTSRWDTVVDLLATALQAGGCAACLINTVADAQALFQRLQMKSAFSDAECILFHARFPMANRLTLEHQLEHQFGKPEQATRPHKAIVVATQVLEQSLDVDFDVMISDLAPIDLLLQRAGRMHRHSRGQRPLGLEVPVLHCLLPDLAVAEPKFGSSQYIYHEYLLAMTGVMLRQQASDTAELIITLPDDVQSLVTQVYEADADCYPTILTDYLDKHNVLTDCSDNTKIFLAKGNVIPLPYEESRSLFREIKTVWDDDQLSIEVEIPPNDEENATDTRPQTRLMRPSITLITLHKLDGNLVLQTTPSMVIDLSHQPDKTQVRALLSQSVTLSDSEWVSYFQAQAVPSGWQKAAGVSHCRAVVFEAGRFSCEAGTLLFDPILGLMLQTSGSR